MKLAAMIFLLLAVPVIAGDPPPSGSKPRVFLAGSEPERITGEALVGNAKGAVDLTRSAPSYDIESMRIFSRECPGVVMTTVRDEADVVIRIERDDPNPTTPFVKANRVAIFNLNGDFVYAARARLLTNASRDACRALLAHVKR
jgi:hypothetical protein